MTKINQIAQAFAQGVKFAENLKLAMDAAKGKDDENGHWVTIGEGEEARPVFIKGAKKKAAKTESKKAESKPAQQRTKKSKTPSAAGLLNEKGSALAQLAEREYDKVITAIKDDIGSIESDPTFPPEVKRYETVPIKSNLRNIKSKLSDVNKDLSTVKDEVSKAVKDGNFNRQGVESVWRGMKQLKDRAAYVISHTNSETAWLGRNNASGMNETADTLNRLSNEASGIRQDANRLKEEVRGSIAQFERENTERTRDQ